MALVLQRKNSNHYVKLIPTSLHGALIEEQ
jgi:hypothetical protein